MGDDGLSCENNLSEHDEKGHSHSSRLEMCRDEAQLGHAR